MSLLINEPPLQVLPSLAKKIGLVEAIILQQIHFRLQISQNVRDGYTWVFNTYEDWHVEFPFLSIITIKRAILRLEQLGYIVSTNNYNKIKMDKTKWYRVNYEKLAVCTNVSKCTARADQIDTMERINLNQAIPKENKNNNKYVEQLDDIIAYLNEKTGKKYRTTTKATIRVVKARLNEGFTVEDFKRVIDIKSSQWLHNAKMNAFLRPATLFGQQFEGYLNETVTTQPDNEYEPPSFDFSAGEDLA